MSTSRVPLLIAGLALAAMSAGPGPAAPEVVRVRVPAAKVDAWFPPGAERISLPIADFEDLARRATAPAATEEHPGLIRAEHRAAWRDGVLVGVSTLTVRRPEGRAVSVPLAPWNLAIEAAEGTGFQVRSDGAGNTSLWLPPDGPGEVSIRWRLAAGAGSLGRSFGLRLPEVVPSSIELDLPDGLVPERFVPAIPPGGGPATGRRSWRLDGAAGAVGLRLGASRGPGEPGVPWVSGPTTVAVGAGGASWRADWTVDLAGPSRDLRVEFGPGLVPIEATGPGVESSRVAGGGVLEIRFRPDQDGPTAVALRALGSVPAGGPWTVATARPIGAAWLGGLITVRLDPTRVVGRCRVLQGRRVAPPPRAEASAADPGAVLVFEPTHPGPVAELTFDGGDPLRGAEIRGLLRTAGAVTTLRAEIRWTSPRGTEGEAAFDLSPGWSIDRIASEEGDALPWHKEASTGEGPARVRVATPPDAEGGPPTLTVSATRIAPAGTAPFEVPRLIPVGMPDADEVWVATADGDRVQQPGDAPGLAWIEPGEALTAGLREGLDPAEVARALAWRWTGEAGRLVVSIVPAPREVVARIDAVAALAEGRLRLDWRATIRPGSRPIGAVPLFLSQEAPGMTWRLRDPAGPATAVATRPLGRAERALAGLPVDRGVAFEVALPEATSAPIVLEGTADGAESADRDCPLLMLPPGFHPRASLVVRVGRDLLTRVDASGVREDDADVGDPARPDDPPASGPLRTAHVLQYDDADARLRVFAERSTAGVPESVVASARLETGWGLSDARTDRLVMEIRPGRARGLRLVAMPPGRLVAVTVDGRPVAPVAEGRGVLIPLGPDRGRVGSRVSLEWTSTVAEADRRRGTLRPGLPAIDAPCLRFSWTLRLPEGCAIAEAPPGLRASLPVRPDSPVSLLRRGAPVDRFRAVSGPSTADDPLDDRDDADPGSLRLEGSGWPDAGAGLRVVRGDRSLFAMVAIGLGVFTIGMIARGVVGPGRGVVAGAILAVAVLGVGGVVPLPGPLAAGLAVGMAGLFTARLVRPARPRSDPARPTDSSRGSRSGLSGLGPVSTAVGLAMVLGTGPGGSLGRESTGDGRILVLLPYDSPADLDRPPVRAVLLLADHDRLRAEAARLAVGPPGVASAIEADHRFEVAADGSARWTSEFGLVVDGPGPAEWRVPTEGAGDIRASLDGQSIPLRMVDGGRAASARLVGEGRHTLRVDRRVGLGDGPSPRVLGVNAVAKARLTVVAPPGGPAGGASWDLGPSSTLELHRRDPAAGRPARGLSALVLWDARPAGDLARVRLAATGPESVAGIALAIEPGVQVRCDTPGRLVDSGTTVGPAGPVWRGAFDPPIRADRPVLLEFWRPVAPGGPATGGGGLRRCPRVASADGGTFSGWVAFRRPGDWSGRLEAPARPDAPDDESFVKAWGALPDEPYTLAGTRGFGDAVEVSARAGPVPVARTVRPAVRLDVGQGRVDVQVRAEVRDVRGRSTDLDLVLPPGLVLDSLTADGLVSLSRPEETRAHLELRPIDGPSRTVVLSGHRLVPVDRGSPEAQVYRTSVPWPSWPGATEVAGLLTVGSLVRSELESGPGVRPLAAAEPVGVGVGAPTVGRVYQVMRPGDLGALRWPATPPRVVARLHSRLGIGRASAELETTIRYDATGGPIEALYLKAPASWALNAEIELVGDSAQRTAETRGDWTYWTIRPGRPLWGAARLRFRSSAPIVGGRPLAFPDVTPLGQGTVDKTLAVERRTALAIELEGSAGLQSIDASRALLPSEPATLGPILGAFRVSGDPWSLGITVGAVERKGGGPDGSVPVAQAEIEAVVGPDGGTVGVASYRAEGRIGGELRVRLPATARVLSVDVGGRPTLPLSTTPGLWVIPIGSAGDLPIELVWTAPGLPVGPGESPLSLPSLAQPDVPTILAVRTVEGVSVRLSGTRFEAMNAPAWSLEKVDRLARRVVDRAGAFDRSSAEQERDLIDLLRAFLSERRAATRSVDAALREPGANGKGALEQVRTRLDRLGEVVDESLELDGLDDLREAAARETRPEPRRPPSPSASRPGRATYYRSTIAPIDAGPGAVIVRPPASPWPGLAGWWAVPAGLACLALGPILARARPDRRATASARLGLAVALLTIAAFAPIPAAFAALAGWLGPGRD